MPTPTISRSKERIYYHYIIEKELANRLKHANKIERRTLYTAVYDELFQRVPDHPQLTRKADAAYLANIAAEQLRFLKFFLRPTTTFLEVGAGDCNLSFNVAPLVKQVYGVDVSAEVTKAAVQPENFALILSDGTSIPVPPGSIDVAYSNQLMEHLHPDDALEQLQHIAMALTPDGVYICLTPNPISGPHDVSRHFDDHPIGFHLKEYTTTELAALFKQAGFRKTQVFVIVNGRVVLLPVQPVIVLERILAALPRRTGKQLARRLPVRNSSTRLLGRSNRRCRYRQRSCSAFRAMVSYRG